MKCIVAMLKCLLAKCAQGVAGCVIVEEVFGVGFDKVELERGAELEEVHVAVETVERFLPWGVWELR